MPRILPITLLILALGFVCRAQLPRNNFGGSRDLLKIHGRLYADTAWSKPLNNVLIEVKILTNRGDRYLKAGDKVKLNPDFIPEYKPVGKLETDPQGQFEFHIDMQREYQVVFMKPAYRRRIVDVLTFVNGEAKSMIKAKWGEKIPEYSTSGILEPYKSGLIGPPVEGLSSKIMFSIDSTVRNFTLREELQTRDMDDDSQRFFAKHKVSQEEKQKRNRNDFVESQTIQDVVDKSIGLVYKDDTINVVDSNLNRQGGWVYFGSETDDAEFQDHHKVYEGDYMNGLKEDRWTRFYPNQNKALDLTFISDQFNGQFTTYYESGEIESKGTYNRGLKKKVADFDLFYKAGNLKADFQFDEDGRKNGQQYAYYPNGNLAVSAVFKNDTLHGPMLIMERSGKILEQRMYEHGKLVGTTNQSSMKIDVELDSLITLFTKDDRVIEQRVENALLELDTIEERYDTILSERMKELEALRAQLSDTEMAALKAQKEADRMKALNDLKEEKLRRNRTLFVAFGLVTLIILSLLVLLYRRNEEKKKINEVLKEQKEQIEEKNREITDSINYAKRLQDAIMPPLATFKKELPSSFVLYLPKDIVAGDFYWMEAIEGEVFFAAADCTGHGVPGAFVSVVCNNALNRSVREFGLRKPADILFKTSEIVEETFAQSDEEVKDGMDISLCCYHKATGKLQWAGANNPIWIVTSNKLEVGSATVCDTSNLELSTSNLLEIKADKQPIGKHHQRVPYTNHQFYLKTGDSIYLFSDGFPDQFGGPKGKKFKYSNFKKLLLNTNQLSPEEQEQRLTREFENWKGELEQIDDVCVIRFKA